MSTSPELPRIDDYVDHWERGAPEREALVSDSPRWSYRELAAQVDRLSRVLMANGVAHGDRVAIMGTPRPECFATMLAASRIGAITLGLNPKFGCPSSATSWTTPSRACCSASVGVPRATIARSWPASLATARRTRGSWSEK